MRVRMGSFFDTASVKVTRFVTAALIALMFLSCGGPLPSADRVSFRTRDGFLLEGRLFGSGTIGVVMAHAFPADQSSWYEFAHELSREGYLVLTFNFRGYGESEGTREISVLDRDVVAATQYLTDQGAEKVVLIGASMGGTASLVAASKIEVSGVATVSAPTGFMGLDAIQALIDVFEPRMYVAATDDPSNAEQAAEALLRADPTARLKLVGGSAHGTDMLKGRRGEEVRKSIEDFIAEVTSR